MTSKRVGPRGRAGPFRDARDADEAPVRDNVLEEALVSLAAGGFNVELLLGRSIVFGEAGATP
jgi:hypothetical protein